MATLPSVAKSESGRSPWTSAVNGPSIRCWFTFEFQLLIVAWDCCWDKMFGMGCGAGVNNLETPLSTTIAMKMVPNLNPGPLLSAGALFLGAGLGRNPASFRCQAGT